MTQTNSNENSRPFIPEKPSEAFIRAAQEVVHAQLQHQTPVYLSDQDLNKLKELPKQSGLILAPNHADETDPRLCLEISRLSGRRLISMCNREAFDELFGLAGYVLQRLGHFSVERGAHDTNAIEHAIEVVKRGSDGLVVFPEGEIFYLNEEIQPMHAGAIEIGMQAIQRRRAEDESWQAFVMPVAIKYHYPENIESLLERRLTRLESHLLLPHLDATPAMRLQAIQSKLLQKEIKEQELPVDPAAFDTLLAEIKAAESALIAKVEARHKDLSTYQKHLIDQAWQLEAELRNDIAASRDPAEKRSLQADLDRLKEVAQLDSWDPQYYQSRQSKDRLAEALLKMERELYHIHRPKQLTRRNAHIKLGEPIKLADYLSDYDKDAKALRHNLTQKLHDQIQGMIEEMVAGLQ